MIPCSKHRYQVWIWTTMVMPTTVPFPLRGWWTRCTKCKLDYKYDMEASEKGRPWWKLFRFYREGP